MLTEMRECALCGSQNYALIFNVTLAEHNQPYGSKLGKSSLVKCSRCGLIYINPRPKESLMKAYYPEKYFRNRVLGNVADDIYRLLIAKRLLRISKLKGKVLDVGCGDGSFLFIMKKYGWDTYGVDVSASAVKLAEEKVGKKRIFHCRLEECGFPASHFDVVCLRHVLEHLHKPFEELIEIKRILKEEGILVIVVPNIDSLYFRVLKKNWFHLDIPRHLYDFSLKTLLDKVGFDMVKSSVSLEDPLDWFRGVCYFFGVESRPFPKFLLPALLVVALMNLPLSILLSLFNRGTVIQCYFRPKNNLLSSMEPEEVEDRSI